MTDDPDPACPSPTENTYILRFPFQLAPEREISGFPGIVERDLKPLRLRLSRDGIYYVCELGGFQNQAEAEGFAPLVWQGLAWVLLEYAVAFEAESTAAPMTRPADPRQAALNLSRSFGGVDLGEVVHGLGDTHRPTVYQTGDVIRWLGTNAATVRAGVGLENFLSSFEEGLRVAQRARSSAVDPKIHTALDLYRSSYYESSPSSRSPAEKCYLANRWRNKGLPAPLGAGSQAP